MAHRGDARSFPVRPISITQTAADRADHDDRADLNQMAQTIRGRTPRSPIEPRSRIIRRGITSTIIVWQLLEHQYHDRGPIAARSWPDCGAIVVLFEAKLKLTHNQIGAELKPRPMPNESLPRPLQIDHTTASIAHDLRANFSF